MRTLTTSCVVDEEGCLANVKSAMARGLPLCHAMPLREGKVAIVGAGPSVAEYRDELLGFDGEVWAINGAYGYLTDVLGRTPDGFVACDPLPDVADLIANPQRRTAFYIASTCHPCVFDKLRGFDVRVWHSARGTVDTLRKFFGKGAPIVPGGITCMTRAPFLAYVLGWREVHIYGADSSYDYKPWCYDSDAKDCGEQTIRVRCNGQTFKTERGMLHQCSYLASFPEIFPGKLVFRTNGLLQAFLSSPMRNVEDFIEAENVAHQI